MHRFASPSLIVGVQLLCLFHCSGAHDGDHCKKPQKLQQPKGGRRMKGNKTRTGMTKSTITAWLGSRADASV